MWLATNPEERSAEEQEVAAGAGIGGMEASTSVAEVSQV